MKNNFVVDLNGMEKFAEKLTKLISFPFNILLFGDLGSGKTTFAKFFIQSFFDNKFINVTSPTFTILQNYNFPPEEKSIIHVDLYRIINQNELEEIDILSQIGNNLCLIEWPQIIEGFCSENTIKIYLKTNENDSNLRDVLIIHEFNLFNELL